MPFIMIYSYYWIISIFHCPTHMTRNVKINTSLPGVLSSQKSLNAYRISLVAHDFTSFLIFLMNFHMKSLKKFHQLFVAACLSFFFFEKTRHAAWSLSESCPGFARLRQSRCSEIASIAQSQTILTIFQYLHTSTIFYSLNLP